MFIKQISVCSVGFCTPSQEWEGEAGKGERIQSCEKTWGSRFISEELGLALASPCTSHRDIRTQTRNRLGAGGGWRYKYP